MSMLSRTCTVMGKAEKKGDLPLLARLAQQYCKDAGVCRLPVTMGDGWCWLRMLGWLSEAVRVGGPQHGPKTIREGVAAAKRKQTAIEMDGGVIVEGRVVVLVEPDVYEEGIEIDGGGQCVSIWGCDRECGSKKGEMQRVEWRSRDECTLMVVGDASVSLNGMHMSAMKSVGYDGDGFNCVYAHEGATLSLERCDITCEDLNVIEIADENTMGPAVGCWSALNKAKATLENNSIHSDTNAGVQV